MMVYLFQVRDALVVTTMGGAAAPPSCPAATARVTATGPGTGAPMTATEAASEVRGVVVVIVIVTQLLFCPGLVCGSNNCLKFGLYYHEKDDCCDLPQPGSTVAGVSSGVLTSASANQC